jgi:hypothetical protein
LLPPTAAELVAALETFEVEPVEAAADDVEVVATAAEVVLVDAVLVDAVLPVVPAVVWLWLDAADAVWVTPAMIPAVATPPATTTPRPATRARRTREGVLVMHRASATPLS